MSTDVATLETLLNKLWLDNSKELREELATLQPVIFTEGDDDAIEAIIQGVPGEPIIVACQDTYRADTFKPIASLAERLFGRKPEADTTETGVIKVPGCYTVIRGGVLRKEYCRSDSDSETKEAAERILKELPKDDKSYHAILHTTAHTLASSEALMKKFGAVTMTSAVGNTLPGSKGLMMTKNTVRDPESFSKLLRTVQENKGKFFAPSLPLLGMSGTKSDQLPERESLLSLPMHPDDAARLRANFRSMQAVGLRVPMAEAYLAARSAAASGDIMRSRVKEAVDRVYKDDPKPSEHSDDLYWINRIQSEPRYQALSGLPPLWDVARVINFPCLTSTDCLAHPAMMCEGVSFVPITIEMPDSATSANRSKEERPDRGIIAGLSEEEEHPNCFLPMGGPSVKETFFNSLTPVSKILTPMAKQSEEPVSVVDLHGAKEWHVFSHIMHDTLKGCLTALDTVHDDRLSPQKKSSLRKKFRTALTNLTEGPMTRAAKASYREAGLEWTVPQAEEDLQSKIVPTSPEGPKTTAGEEPDNEDGWDMFVGADGEVGPDGEEVEWWIVPRSVGSGSAQ